MSVAAAVLEAPRRMELTQVELRPPARGRVHVAVEGCGVCGSNLPLWQGRPWFEYPQAPGVPGHEAWGRVVAVGEAAEHSIGSRVAVLCDNAFAGAVDVPAADAVPLPPALDGVPFPGEALGCACNIALRSGFAAGVSVCVVGAGFLGAAVIGLAAAAGAGVVAVSRRRFALDVAARMGARACVVLDATAESTVLDSNGGRLFDVVVEAVGNQEALDLAGRLVAERGHLVIAGFHQEGRRTVDMQLWNWRGIDVVNAHERDASVRRRGIELAIDAVVSGRLDPAPLYTHTFALDRVGDAMNALEERPEGFLKALVCA